MRSRGLLSALAFLLSGAATAPPPVTTYGVGTAKAVAPSFDALATGIGTPTAVAVGADGAVYVASAEARRVFKVVGGRLTVVAGGGSLRRVFTNTPRSGDGAPAAGSALSRPASLAVGPQGDVYIGDDGDGVVRRIDARTGIITTLLGSLPEGPPPLPGTSGPPDTRAAELRQPVRPSGLAVDAVGNLYVADRAAHQVFRIRPDGAKQAMAGSGVSGYVGDSGPAVSARLASPAGIVLDAAGDLFIADRGNHCVRRVDARTGIITTFAGNGVAGDSGDGGPAAAAELRDPAAVAVDARGTLFIADLGNRRLRRASLTMGRISTDAGFGEVDASAVAVAADGAVWVADAVRGVVLGRRDHGAVTTIAGNGGLGVTGDGGAATAAFLSEPSSLARDAEGNLYIAEAGAHRVRRVDATSGLISTAAGTGRDGYFGDGGPATHAALSGPQGIAFDREGCLLIADTGNHRVRRVARDGTITTVAGSGRDGLADNGVIALDVDLGRPSAIAANADGNVFVAQGWYGLIHRIDASGALATITGRRSGGPLLDGKPAVSGHVERIAAVALGRGGLFFADDESMRVWRIDDRTGLATIVAGRGPTFVEAPPDDARGVALGAIRALALDGRGNLYVGDVPSGVRRVDASTRGVTALFEGAPRFAWPAALLWADPDSLYLAESGGRVWRLGPDGRPLAVAGGGVGF